MAVQPRPATPTRQPAAAPERLDRGSLRLVDITAATMANIGPAMSFYFGFGLIATTAGLASPLTIIAAGIAIAFLANTLAEFSRAHPSTGGFITFVGRSFGGTAAVATAIITGCGYIIAMASVVAISGGFLSITISRWLHVSVPWEILTIVLTALAVAMMVRGVALSTKVAGLFFGFEMLVLVAVSVASLVTNRGHLSVLPFEPSHLHRGFSGLAAGFPLAVYLFIGWENSAALAEETDQPRRNVPRAVFTSTAVMAVSYVLFSYATVEGFHGNVTALGNAAIPFITVANGTLGTFAVFAYLAGLTSTLGALIAGTNAQARLVFNAGREGVLPRFIGRVHPRRRTPTVAIFTFIGIALVIIGAWAVSDTVGHHHLDPVNFFAESSTMGTILVLVVYLLSNLALPVYYRRYRPAELSVVRHGILPLLGAAAIVVPLYYLAKPGQPAPYSWYPYIALAIIVAAAAYAVVLVRRDPGIGDRVGSILADE